jgi:hypothetical protein
VTSPCLELDAFVDGELGGAAAAAFRLHLAGCERCRVALEGRMAEQVIAEADDAGAGAGLAAAPPSAPLGRWRDCAAPIAAAAAALAIWLVGARGGDRARPVELEVAFDRPGEAVRGDGARVGDVAHLAARSDGHCALWVYRGDRELVVACPGDPRCSDAAGELRLELALIAAGPYSVVALVAAAPIAAPAGPLDVVLSEATARGARIQITYVDVN